MDWTTLIIGLLSAFFGGGALIGFIQFLMQRKDNSMESRIIKRFDKVDAKMEDFKSELKVLDRKIDDNQAKQARVRILRFSDELQSGQKFSKDSFNQTFTDISDYKSHCSKYKDFPNNQAEHAMNNINHIYEERLELERHEPGVFL